MVVLTFLRYVFFFFSDLVSKIRAARINTQTLDLHDLAGKKVSSLSNEWTISFSRNTKQFCRETRRSEKREAEGETSVAPQTRVTGTTTSESLLKCSISFEKEENFSRTRERENLFLNKLILRSLFPSLLNKSVYIHKVKALLFSVTNRCH